MDTTTNTREELAGTLVFTAMLSCGLSMGLGHRSWQLLVFVMCAYLVAALVLRRLLLTDKSGGPHIYRCVLGYIVISIAISAGSAADFLYAHPDHLSSQYPHPLLFAASLLLSALFVYAFWIDPLRLALSQAYKPEAQ